MPTYIIGWPNNSWSVMVTRRAMTREELISRHSLIDAIDCPSRATILKARCEDGEFICDLPAHQRKGGPPDFPSALHGSLEVVHLQPPYGAVVSELQGYNVEDSDG